MVLGHSGTWELPLRPWSAAAHRTCRCAEEVVDDAACLGDAPPRDDVIDDSSTGGTTVVGNGLQE